MRLYYVVYKYSNDYEMIAGPYGTAWEAHAKRNELGKEDDPHLMVVRENINIVELE